jgi:hypothetical protein
MPQHGRRRNVVNGRQLAGFRLRHRSVLAEDFKRNAAAAWGPARCESVDQQILTGSSGESGTSSYGDLIEVERNIGLLVYDYLPAGFRRLPAVNQDWCRVFALRIDLFRYT